MTTRLGLASAKRRGAEDHSVCAIATSAGALHPLPSDGCGIQVQPTTGTLALRTYTLTSYQSRGDPEPRVYLAHSDWAENEPRISEWAFEVFAAGPGPDPVISNNYG